MERIIVASSTMLQFFQRHYIEAFKGLSRQVWSLSLMILINRSGMMVVPFLSIYMIKILGWTSNQAAIANSVYGLAGLCGAFLGAWLCDRFGTYKVMLFSLIIAGFSFFAYPFFKEFYSLTIWIFTTVSMAETIRPATFTAVSEYSKEDNVARGISLVRVAINLGISIGPALGGFLAFHYGYNWLFIVDGLTCLVAAVVLYISLNKDNLNYTPKKKDKSDKTNQNPYTDRQFLIFAFFNLIVLSVFFQILFATPVYFERHLGIPENIIGWFFTANGLLIFLFEMPIIKKLEGGNHFYPLVIGGIMIGLAYVSYSVFQIPLVAIIIHSLLIGFGEIINFPFISTISLKRAGEINRAKYMGAVTVLFSLAIMFAPIGLSIINSIGYHNYWILCGLLAIIASTGILLTRHSLQPISQTLNDSSI